MEKYYIRIEGVNLANFVYDTEDLSTVRGGGLLLLNAPDCVYELIKKQFSNITFYIITKGASSAIFYFEADSDCAKKINEAIILYLKEEDFLRYGTFVVDLLEATLKDGKIIGFIKDKEKLIAMNRWQQMQNLSMSLPETTTNDTLPCSIDLIRPGVEKGPDNKKISDSVYYRRKYGRLQKQSFYKDTLNYTINSIIQYGFTNDFDELTSFPDSHLNHKMAVVYLDGNSFGAIQREKCTDPEIQKKFDETIRDKRKELLKSLFEEVINKKPELWLTGEKNQTNPKYRFETLLWGGDELIWVVPACKGWDTLSFFYEKSKDWKILGNQPLTNSGGLIFCHHNAPIYRIKKIVKELADKVKDEIKPKGNFFSYLVLESFDFVENLDEYFGKFKSDIPVKDYIIDGLKMKDIKNKFIYLKNYNFPRSKIYDIVRKIQNNQGVNICDLSVDKIFLSPLESLCASLNGCEAMWYHIASLWDYIDE